MLTQIFPLKKAEGWAEAVPMVPTQKFMMLRLPQKRTDLFLLQTNRNRNQRQASKVVSLFVEWLLKSWRKVFREQTHTKLLWKAIYTCGLLWNREMKSCTHRADALSKHGTLVKSIFIMCVLVILQGEHGTDSQAVATVQLLFFVFRDRRVRCFFSVPFILTSTKWVIFLFDLRMWVGNGFSFYSML